MENPTSIATLRNLLDHEVANLISAEVHLKKNLTEWIKISNSLKFKNVLQRYLVFIEEHIRDLEEFFLEENLNSLGLSNAVMAAYIQTAEEKCSFCSDPEIKDACLLASIQHINHFKICAYGTASAYAKTLDMKEAAIVFHTMEINEKHIDDRLSQLAEFEININAKTPISLP